LSDPPGSSQVLPGWHPPLLGPALRSVQSRQPSPLVMYWNRNLMKARSPVLQSSGYPGIESHTSVPDTISVTYLRCEVEDPRSIVRLCG
jgi:hypothetical protein